MADVFLSVVLPCHNQADHIADVLRGYRAPMQAIGRPYELIVVPNACTDHTEAEVAAVAHEDAAVRVVASRQGGWGLAVRLGLDAADGEVVCYTNTARTLPKNIPPLLDMYLRHAPCVAKVRREKRQAPARAIGSWLYNLEARLLFGSRTTDVNGTPKILSRALYRDLKLRSDGDLIDLELIAKVTRREIPVLEVPVEGFQRHGGRTTTNLASAWKMYTGAIRLQRELSNGQVGP